MAEDVKYIEVDGQKFVDDGTGSQKLDDDGNPIPFVEEKTVPYSRFKEVNDEKKALDGRVKELESKKTDGTITPEQQKELDAKIYLKKLVSETLSEVKKAEEEAKQSEDKKFKDEVNEALELNPDVKKADFVKFLEKEADSYGVTSVDGGMKLFKRLNTIKEETADKTKKDVLSKPKSLKTEGAGGEVNWTEKDKGKSISQIVEEVKKTLTGK